MYLTNYLVFTALPSGKKALKKHSKKSKKTEYYLTIQGNANLDYTELFKRNNY